jgi:hypothetical protein
MLSISGEKFKISPAHIRSIQTLERLERLHLNNIYFSSECSDQLKMIKEMRCLEQALFDRCEWEVEAFLFDLLESELCLSHVGVGKVSSPTASPLFRILKQNSTITHFRLENLSTENHLGETYSFY